MLSLIAFVNAQCQKEDFIWLFGYDLRGLPDDDYGATNIDFNFDPVKIYYDQDRQWNFSGGNSSICDKNGQLLAYSNGQVIINAKNIAIEDTINYGSDAANSGCLEWEYNNVGNQSKAETLGLLGHERVTIIPSVDKFYVIYNTYDYCSDLVYKLSYASFELDNNHPNGHLIFRDKMILKDSFITALHVLRHGNGRDWWMVTFSTSYEWMYSFLVDMNGIKLNSKVKTGLKTVIGSDGQINISPDGKYLAFYVGSELFSPNGGGFGVVDFDRCDGSISNLRTKIIPQPTLGLGTAFSSDSRYLYVCNGNQIRQYDMKAPDFLQSERLAAQYDGYEYFSPYDTINMPLRYPVNFCLMKLAPDGRIYVFPNSASTRMMSVMEHPTRDYKTCDVRQHSITMPTVFARTVPTMPEYRLGPLDGSPCDTLGLDNHPIAKYRYEPDTSDHLQLRFTDLSYFRPETWSWDFGDGSPKSGIRHPDHTYTKNGTYMVCLAVSNENSSNTSCRTITIGTSSSDDTDITPADITLFPNPVEDMLLITIGEYIPEHGLLTIYDITGHVVIRQRVYYGHNNTDMGRLPSGMYVWKLTDGSKDIKQGKVVKM